MYIIYVYAYICVYAGVHKLVRIQHKTCICIMVVRVRVCVSVCFSVQYFPQLSGKLRSTYYTIYSYRHILHYTFYTLHIFAHSSIYVEGIFSYNEYFANRINEGFSHIPLPHTHIVIL